MKDKVVKYRDILEPRRNESGIFSFMTRSWKPVETMKLDRKTSPQEIKDIAAKSVYLDSIIEAECARSGVSKEKLHKEVKAYLEEMGMDKKMHVIRWMGIIFLKISFMMKIQMFVNEPEVLKLKSSLGSNPVLFLPTHRSYADFCLMTYLCYHYDIELPAVAAGMDFYSMAVLGRRMRETGAFYIRRTLAGDRLYSATLKQYVRTLVAKHGAPVEFFLEGTRSRSNKSLPPKYGILSMALLPYFAREVSDITIVPVNICYDRLMEQVLFAYELLGVPKPKESTGGFLKALRSLNEDFGNMHIKLGTPISVRNYLHLQEAPRTADPLIPLDLEQLTPDQFKQVQDLADRVIIMQQKNTIVTGANLLAMALMQSYTISFPMAVKDILDEMNWMCDFLLSRGANVYAEDFRQCVDKILQVHHKLMKVDRNGKLRLVMEPMIHVSNEMQAKMKGHIFDAPTMALALPVIQLQLYVNPALHYMMPLAFMYLIAAKKPTFEDEMADWYQILRSLLRFEYYYADIDERMTYQEALDYCVNTKIILRRNDHFTAEGGNEKLHFLLRWAACPSLSTLKACIDSIYQYETLEHRQALQVVQKTLLSRGSHPYCLSIELISNCLQGLSAFGAVRKQKGREITYSLVRDIMYKCHHVVGAVLPGFRVFGRNNTVLLDERPMARL